MKRTKIMTIVLTALILTSIIPFNANATETTVTKSKKANPITVTIKSKSYKKTTLSKSAKTVKLIRVTKAKGKISYKKLSGNKKIKVNSKSGKITIKKGSYKSGKTYSIKVKITAKGNDSYKTKSITKTVKIKIKSNKKYSYSKSEIKKLINKNIKSGKIKLTAKVLKKSPTIRYGSREHYISDNVFDIHYYIPENTSFDKLMYDIYEKNNKTFGKIFDTLGETEYKSSNTKVFKVEKGQIIPISKGTATLTAKAFKNTDYPKTIKTTVKITKPTTIKYKKANDTICKYSYKAIYDYIKTSFYEHVMKGEKADYQYVACFCGEDYDSIENKIYNKFPKYDDKEKLDGYNFQYYEGYNEGHPGIHSYIENNDTIGIPILKIDYDSDLMNVNKTMYQIADKMLKDYKIYDIKDDYDKVLAIGKMMNENFTYGGSSFPYDVLKEKQGVCSGWTDVTIYFCSLMKIPVFEVESRTHAWNIVYYKGKYYYLDILWKEYFKGKKDIAQEDHIAKDYYKDIVDKVEDYAYVPPAPPIPTIPTIPTTPTTPTTSPTVPTTETS